MTATFSKSPSSNTDLIALLKVRGLHTPDARQAERALSTIGYYRLSGYTLLLETPGTFTAVGTTSLYMRSHTFRAGASFRQLLALQQFDQELHLMVLKALLQLEVAARSLISNHMALKYNDPHWYLNPALFDQRYVTPRPGRPKSGHDMLLEEIARETGQRNPKRRTAFSTYYYTVFNAPPLPPSWMVAEQLSFGSWSVIYSQLGSSRDRKDIADAFNVGPNELESWLRALAYLRNMCAHQNRLLGVNFVQTPMASSKLPVGIRNTSFAAFVAVIHHLLREIEPGHVWVSELKDLFRKYPSVDKHALLGFPVRWSQRTFWRS